MSTTISTEQVITKEHTAQVRRALKRANLRATVRKGSGSMRWTLTVTTKKHKNDVIEVLRSIGYEFKYQDNWRTDVLVLRFKLPGGKDGK